MALADYQNLVSNLVRDQSNTVAVAHRDQAIQLALLRYSADAERELVEDVTWPAASYLAPLPTGWLTGCYLRSAEYPIGQQPAAIINMAVYMDPTEQKLVAEDELPAGAVVRVTFAAPHQLEGTAEAAIDTIPLVHREAVASYAAHLLCKQLASHFSGQRETAVGSDLSNMDSRARNYANRAKEYRVAYYAGIGKADPQIERLGAAGSGATPAASASSWGGRARASLVRESLS